MIIIFSNVFNMLFLMEKKKAPQRVAPQFEHRLDLVLNNCKCHAIGRRQTHEVIQGTVITVATGSLFPYQEPKRARSPSRPVPSGRRDIHVSSHFADRVSDKTSSRGSVPRGVRLSFHLPFVPIRR